MKLVRNATLSMTMLLITIAGYCQNYQAIPEFIFKNAQLISGTSNQDGAVYKFSNIAPGYDAKVTILGRSAANVVLDTIDLASLGWDKALQPQLGIQGNVPKNSSWWMKFRLDFLQAGTNSPANIDKFTSTALDIDGDGLTIQENLTMFKANSVNYCSSTNITQFPLAPAICPNDGKSGTAKLCATCNGLGYWVNGGGKQKKCKDCDGSGYVFSTCGDPWTGTDIKVQGSVVNAKDIDTSATQAMASFTYNNVSSFTFQYGGVSGNAVSNAGERLNSMWFKAFSLAPQLVTLPVTIMNFTAQYGNKNVNLSWTTSSEINFSHFVIERSDDGINYGDIAYMFSNGGINQVTNYSYKDPNVISSTGLIYYRLRTVDMGKEASYSETRVIRIKNIEQKIISITTYPNPVSDQLRVTFPDTWQGKAVILELYSGNGSRLQNKQISNASQTESLNMSNFSRGFYLVKAICNNEIAEQRIIKN